MFSEHGSAISAAALRLSMGHDRAAKMMVEVEARRVCRAEYEMWQDVVDGAERIGDISKLTDEQFTHRKLKPRQLRERSKQESP